MELIRLLSLKNSVRPSFPPKTVAEQAMRLAAHKLSIRTKFIERSEAV